MSVVPFDPTRSESDEDRDTRSAPSLPSDHHLHRLEEVRQTQGVSRRTLARRLNTDVRHVKWQERPSTDMLLSELYRWQEALEVPVGELLVESEEPLSAPVMRRAQLVKLMKTAMAISERAQQPMICRMAETLIEQLCEFMPELRGVSPWHAVGRRRTQEELGTAAQRNLSMDALRDRGGEGNG